MKRLVYVWLNGSTKFFLLTVNQVLPGGDLMDSDQNDNALIIYGVCMLDQIGNIDVIRRFQSQLHTFSFIYFPRVVSDPRW